MLQELYLHYLTKCWLIFDRILGNILQKILIKIERFYSRKLIWKCSLQNDSHFVSATLSWLCLFHTTYQRLFWVWANERRLYFVTSSLTGWSHMIKSHYNKVSCLQNPHSIYPIIRLWERVIRYMWLVHGLIYAARPNYTVQFLFNLNCSLALVSDFKT